MREADTLARRVLDDELAALTASLLPGAQPLKFDLTAAQSGSGNGWIMGSVPPTPSSYESSLRTPGANGYAGDSRLRGWEEDDES